MTSIRGHSRAHRFVSYPLVPRIGRTCWQIADRLGCPIDLAVGREDIDAPELEGIQPRYDALSPEGRKPVDSYLSYAEESEAFRSRLVGRR